MKKEVRSELKNVQNKKTNSITKRLQKVLSTVLSLVLVFASIQVYNVFADDEEEWRDPAPSIDELGINDYQIVFPYTVENYMYAYFEYDDYDEEVLSAGDHYVKAGLNEILVFVRKGHVLPLAEPSKGMDSVREADMSFICYDAEPGSYELYTDDGISRI